MAGIYLAIAFAAYLLIAPPVMAHAPEGTVYKVFHFSDESVPAMDGDLSDWEVVPAEYFFDLRHHTEVKEGIGIDHNTADLHIKRAAVGWNDGLNRLYFMAEVADNIHLFSKPADHIDSLDTHNSRRTGAFVHGSDIFEIVIDADHGGERVVNLSDDEAEERRLRSALTQNYHLYMPPLNGSYWHWMWGWATWTDDPAYSAVGWQYAGEHGESGTVIYECYLTPFDDLHPDGPDLSVPHDLQEGEIIGLSWAFLDADTGSPQQRTFWSLSGKREMASRGDALADFQLMPVDTAGRDPRENPPGTFIMTPELDAELEPVPLVVPEKFSGLVPEGITMNLPPGFSVKVFAAAGLEGPRMMDFSPEGVLHAANMKVGGASVFRPPSGANKSQIVALPDRDRDGVADTVIVAVDGLRWANSLAFDRQGNLFVADTHQILRLRDGDGDLVYEEQTVLADIPSWFSQPDDVQHITRTLVLDQVQNKIYVSIGSTCDICRESEDERAVILEMDMDGSNRRIFASGIRNAIGLDLHPQTNQLWAINNGHGREGRLLPPEWIDVIRDGGFYGWPVAYSHQVYVDLSIAQYRSALFPLTLEDSLKVQSMQRPIALVPAHLAPMAIHFYTGDTFPARYHHAAFFALRAGVRSPAPGYKVMALFSKSDGSDARVVDFLTGFEFDPLDRGRIWGQPVGVTSDVQGNLYVSSDWVTHAILKVVPDRLDAFFEGDLPDTVFSGRALEIDALVRVAGHAAGQAPVVTADLSQLGGPDQLPLTAVEENQYPLLTTLPPLQPGLRTIIVRIERQTPADRLVTEVRHPILVAPGEDLVVLGDELAAGWALSQTDDMVLLPAGGPVEAYAGDTALSFQVDKDQRSFWFGWRLDLKPDELLSTEGYAALRFAFHLGDVEIGEQDRFSLTVLPGKTVDLLAEGLLDVGADGWQVIDVPIDHFELDQPFEAIRLSGTLKGTFHLDELRIRTAAPLPETAVVETRVGIQPQHFTLGQNAPNPFNSDTVIRYALPVGGLVELAVYNLVGQKVATLAAGRRTAGTYTVMWDGRDAASRPLASGVYVYRLSVGQWSQSRKLVLLK